jgi:predicted alpha/beta hydrolase family esterase
MTPEVLILPGRGNSGESHWQSHWERREPEFRRVLQREWDAPDRGEWVQALQAAIVANTRPKILVSHSLSCALVAHWAAAYAGSVTGALLVAPSDVERDDYPPGTTGFAPMPLNRLPFTTHVVLSSDDPRVTPARARQFADAWGAQVHDAGAHGHLGGAAGLGSWPPGFAILQRLRT